ncbi:MAG: general secretion pathway protein GspH [Gammaproteobacteria bacterium]|nr:MAG: general secretion pathway protein GspH [Gammaproteobacteria bacterium]RLA61219.1 MAG: general secretion pathway protein GspH [Gammaproteobacteria bacterium]
MINRQTSGYSPRQAAEGFTLIELLAAITIMGLVLAVSIPASVRFYESIQYRQAVRDVITVLGSARYAAVNTGRAQDVIINPKTNEVRLNDRRTQLPEGLNLVVTTAREVNREDEGVIRFYPEGGSSGGGIDIERPGADGVRISVDWLVGRVSHERYALN